MCPQATTPADAVLANLAGLLPELEALYKDIHAHPELSMHETRTAGLAAQRLEAAGYEVAPGIGKTGVVGLLRNGDGPTVMLRADMDALPVKEATNLPYASTVTSTSETGESTPVMHACGHDMHVAWLAGAATLLAQRRDEWKGTLMPVFQPGEETAQGAQAMIDDDMTQRFPKPDVILGQHVMPLPAGVLASRAFTSARLAGMMHAADNPSQMRPAMRNADARAPVGAKATSSAPTIPNRKPHCTTFTRPLRSANPPITPANWVAGVVTFVGRQDNLANREAALVAFVANLLMVVAAIAAIMLTVPGGDRRAR